MELQLREVRAAGSKAGDLGPTRPGYRLEFDHLYRCTSCDMQVRGWVHLLRRAECMRQRRVERGFADWAAQEIGLRRQLFVDDRMVVSSCNMERVLGEGNKMYLGGAGGVLRADKDWELGIGNILSVIRHNDLFRMWYRPFQVWH